MKVQVTVRPPDPMSPMSPAQLTVEIHETDVPFVSLYRLTRLADAAAEAMRTVFREMDAARTQDIADTLCGASTTTTVTIDEMLPAFKKGFAEGLAASLTSGDLEGAMATLDPEEAPAEVDARPGLRSFGQAIVERIRAAGSAGEAEEVLDRAMGLLSPTPVVTEVGGGETIRMIATP